MPAPDPAIISRGSVSFPLQYVSPTLHISLTNEFINSHEWEQQLISLAFAFVTKYCASPSKPIFGMHTYSFAFNQCRKTSLQTSLIAFSGVISSKFTAEPRYMPKNPSLRKVLMPQSSLKHVTTRSLESNGKTSPKFHC